MDTIARVRRAFYVQGWSVKKIVRELHVSRNDMIVRKAEFEENLRQARAELRAETDPRRRKFLEMEIHYDAQIVDLIRKMQRGEPIPRIEPFDPNPMPMDQKTRQGETS